MGVPAKKRLRSRAFVSILQVRVKDLSALQRMRYGQRVPDTAAVRDLMRVLAHHVAQIPGMPVIERISSVMALQCPWMAELDVSAMIHEALSEPKRWKARELGWLLKLSTVERQRCRITTIAACDLTPAEAKARRKARAKERSAARRQAKLAKSRAEYLAQATGEQPWKALGITRRSYFRRKAKQVKKLAQTLPS